MEELFYFFFFLFLIFVEHSTSVGHRHGDHAAALA